MNASFLRRVSEDVPLITTERFNWHLSGGDVNLPSAAQVAENLLKDLVSGLALLQQRSDEFNFVADDRQHRRKWLEARAALDWVSRLIFEFPPSDFLIDAKGSDRDSPIQSRSHHRLTGGTAVAKE